MRLDAAPTPLLLSLLSLSALPSLAVAARPKNAILLSEVQSLTLRSPSKTTSRRLPPIPQLKCLSPSTLCKHADLKTMRCTNQGSSYTSQDIEWACTATVPSTVRLDRTEVICEGYDSPDDVYVLKGSCGVEYTLALTEEGRRKFPGVGRGWGGRSKEGDWGGYLFGVVFVAVLGWIVYSACVQAGGNRVGGGARPRRRRNGGGGGGGWGPGWGPGGGGGGGGWDDPPPPYPGSGPKPSSSTSTEQGWRPGFWSGLAGGAAAGYMAGNRGQRNNNNDRNYGRGGGLWGNNGGSGSWGSGSRSGSGWGSGRSSSPGSAGSGARHESTGYGSTSRR